MVWSVVCGHPSFGLHSKALGVHETGSGPKEAEEWYLDTMSKFRHSRLEAAIRDPKSPFHSRALELVAAYAHGKPAQLVGGGFENPHDGHCGPAMSEVPARESVNPTPKQGKSVDALKGRQFVLYGGAGAGGRVAAFLRKHRDSGAQVLEKRASSADANASPRQRAVHKDTNGTPYRAYRRPPKVPSADLTNFRR